jgi:hypothetical protein
VIRRAALTIAIVALSGTACGVSDGYRPLGPSTVAPIGQADTAAVPGELVGEWTSVNSAGASGFTFTASGTYVWAWQATGFSECSGSGTFTVSGSRLSLHADRGCLPGGIAEHQWSVDSGTLTLLGSDGTARAWPRG